MRRTDKHRRSLALQKKIDRLKADTIRSDGRLERHCDHGVGHTVGHTHPSQLKHPNIWIHGCDGCCCGWEKEREASAGYSGR